MSTNSYLALLRGVNVGGKQKVPMADLRTAFVDLGFAEVRTLLNSGNVVFRTDRETTRPRSKLSSKRNSPGGWACGRTCTCARRPSGAR